MKAKGQKEARDMAYSFLKDILANFFVITFAVLLVWLWMMIA